VRRNPLLPLLALLALLAPAFGPAAVLPEDRADILYHRYSGDDVVVQGPSVLVRKAVTDSISVAANYYTDFTSSASVDVVTTASPYEERRVQKSLSADYLRGKAMYSLGYSNSKENDYESDTVYGGVSQDLFGDLTTVSLGFSRGWDTVGKRGEPDFQQPIDRRNFRIGVTQVLTRKMLLALNFETITEQGFLQSAYRSIRYEDPDLGYVRAPEQYPRTRTGNAASARLKYYLPWRAALEGQYRFYRDTWGVNAHTAGLELTQPAWRRWTFTGSYRYYTQGKADFYSDLFPRADFQNFLARDKEFSTYSNHTVSLGASYAFPTSMLPWLKKGTVNLNYARMMFDYQDFRDLRGFPPGSVRPGTEPIYELDADIIQFFVSFWF
jgi:hypothetical protein